MLPLLLSFVSLVCVFPLSVRCVCLSVSVSVSIRLSVPVCSCEEFNICASFRGVQRASAKKVTARICAPATARDLESA